MIIGPQEPRVEIRSNKAPNGPGALAERAQKSPRMWRRSSMCRWRGGEGSRSNPLLCDYYLGKHPGSPSCQTDAVRAF